MRSDGRSGHLRYAAGLAVLAPLVAEVVASSNTPAIFFPIFLPLLVLIYGLPALLIREVWVRRGIGWVTAVVLGIGYTALNEGLVAATWFKLDPDDAKVLVFTADEVGRSGGVNWTLAVNLSLFHTLWSIAIPIVFMEVWARRRGLSGVRWLGPWATRLSVGLVAFVVVGSLSDDATTRSCEAPTRAIFDECAAGRRGSALLVGIAALFAVVAPCPRPRAPVPGRTRPSDRALRWLGAGYSMSFLVTYFVLPLSGNPGASITGAVVLAVVAIGALARWRRSPDWDPRAAVALGVGAITPGALSSIKALLVLQPVAVALFAWFFLRPLHRRLGEIPEDPAAGGAGVGATGGR